MEGKIRNFWLKGIQSLLFCQINGLKTEMTLMHLPKIHRSFLVVEYLTSFYMDRWRDTYLKYGFLEFASEFVVPMYTMYLPIDSLLMRILRV